VGRQVSQKLRLLGMDTAQDLGEASIDLLKYHFGVLGYYLKGVGKGEDSSTVKTYSYEDAIKSVGHSHTLARDTWNLDIIKSYLMMLCEKTGTRLRQAKLVGKTVSIVVRYGDFESFSKQHSLGHYIKSGHDIYCAAYKIFEKVLPLKKAVRLLGVSISCVAPDAGEQYLFSDITKREELAETVDSINKKYGSFTLKPGSVLICEKFGIYERCGLIGKNIMKRQ
jgi:DNA polymerase IV